MPTLEKIQDVADQAKSEWTKRIWKNAWANSLLWGFTFTLLAIAIAYEAIEKHCEQKLAGQIASTVKVMKFNHAAFHQLAVAQIPIQVLPTQDDGIENPPGFVLVMEGAYAADLRQVNGQNNGCIFFRSSVSKEQIQKLLPDGKNQTQATNVPAK